MSDAMVEASASKTTSGGATQQVDVAWWARGLPVSISCIGYARPASPRSALDEADDVGGTWYWNRYPGARCDIQTIDYSYTFDPELESAWKWSEKYATQPEILRYLGFVADRYDLRRDIRFKTKVTAATWDQAAERWRLATDNGATGILPLLHHGHRLSLLAQAAGDRGRQGLQGRDLFHRPLAASRGQARRQARRGDRHRIVRDSGDPVDRRAGGASHRVPAHRELRASRP